MRNLIWYLSLAAIGLIGAAYAIYNRRHTYKFSTLFVFYFATAGLAWIFEFMVLGLLNSYAYKTGIFNDVWRQNLLGHLILNTTVYPAVAVVMAAYSFKYKWAAFVSIMFTLIEYIYVNLRIYEQHWWRYYMTSVSAFVILIIDSIWFDKITRQCSRSVRVITFYFVALLIVHTPAPILMLLGKQYYYLKPISDYYGNVYLASIVIIFFYHVMECFLLIICTCLLNKWYWRLIPFFVSVVVQSLLLKFDILIFTNGWKLIYTLIVYETFIGIYTAVEGYTLKELNKKSNIM